MLRLSDEDKQLFQQLKEFGVLQHVDGHRLDQHEGVFLITCSDGDQFPDIFTYHSRLMCKQREKERPHTFADHGIALFLATESPLNKNGRGDNLLESIGDVPGIKGISTGILCAHAPCAAATRASLNIAQQIALVKLGKVRVTKHFPSLTIACFLHVDNGEKRSYFINGSKWREWLKQSQRSLIAT